MKSRRYALIAIPVLAAVVVLVLTVVLLTNSRTYPPVAEAYYPPDSWSRELPYAMLVDLENWRERDRKSEIFEVPATAEADAERRLQNVAIVPLTNAQAAAYLGRVIVPGAGRKAYLVRSVCFFKGTGSYSAAQKGQRLLVDHGCLGARSVRMTRQALVVLLPKPATDVYVTASMVE